ncbi:hypothetical protein F0L68_39020 [Solihabitans fulvus]|uniref:Uncharacterized protein n=1 Tax=Solihabitans fulvus TaxID=1892852 RepID=A0A5B2WGZ8_9PSEU|nr:hypothetical protein [Solihabitans fulvus]KAA2250138.1 hypothetical protein F0L68_39020 [Solihabitans fulvus]
MPLYSLSGISVSSWIEMKQQVPARYEVDHLNECATLFFGTHDDYTLDLQRENLRQIIDLATKALSELDTHIPEEDESDQ